MVDLLEMAVKITKPSKKKTFNLESIISKYLREDELTKTSTEPNEFETTDNEAEIEEGWFGPPPANAGGVGGAINKMLQHRKALEDLNDSVSQFGNGDDFPIREEDDTVLIDDEGEKKPEVKECSKPIGESKFQRFFNKVLESKGLKSLEQIKNINERKALFNQIRTVWDIKTGK